MSEQVHDDIDDIFPQAEASVASQSSSVPAARIDLNPFMLAVAVAAVVLLLISGRPWGGDRKEHSDDQHGHVEPVQGGFLVFVSDRSKITLEQDLLMQQMDQFSSEHKLERAQWLDDSDEAVKELIQYAATKGVSPPLVAYISDGHIKRIASWPTGEPPEGKAKLEKFLR